MTVVRTAFGKAVDLDTTGSYRVVFSIFNITINTVSKNKEKRPRMSHFSCFSASLKVISFFSNKVTSPKLMHKIY